MPSSWCLSGCRAGCSLDRFQSPQIKVDNQIVIVRNDDRMITAEASGTATPCGNTRRPLC